VSIKVHQKTYRGNENGGWTVVWLLKFVGAIY